MAYCLAGKAVTSQEDDIVDAAHGEEAQVTNIQIAVLAEELGLFEGSLGL